MGIRIERGEGDIFCDVVDIYLPIEMLEQLPQAIKTSDGRIAVRAFVMGNMQEARIVTYNGIEVDRGRVEIFPVGDSQRIWVFTSSQTGQEYPFGLEYKSGGARENLTHAPNCAKI
jgi:hypothetical protein